MKEQIIKLAQKLIEIESTKENPEALKEVLECALEEVKEFSIERFNASGVPSALVYSGENRPEKFKVILNAHLDVVPGPKKIFEPKVEVEDDKLFGRGAYDMKAAAAVEILVFKELASKLDFPIALQLVCDEEVGGYNCSNYQVEEGVKTELMIAGEPTNFNIGNRAKGVLWLEIAFKGNTAHSAYPWLGENAIEMAMRYVEKMKTIYPNPEKDSWQTTINLARIETENNTYNKVPDSCKILLDIRMVPEDKKDILSNFQQNLPEGAQLSITLDEPAHFTSDGNELVKLLMETTRKKDRECECIYRNGGSDLRHYSKHGMDGVEFGPEGAGHHEDGEWVSISSLGIYYEILKEFLLAIK